MPSWPSLCAVEPEQHLLLEGQRHRQRRVGALPDQPLHLRRGERRDLEHRPRPLDRRRHQLLVRHHRRREAELEGPLAGDAPRREHDVGGHVLADRAGQPLRSAAAGREAEQPLRQAEPRARRAEDDVAAERDLEPAAERIAADRGDGRLGQRLELVEDAPALELVVGEGLSSGCPGTRRCRRRRRRPARPPRSGSRPAPPCRRRSRRAPPRARAPSASTAR